MCDAHRWAWKIEANHPELVDRQPDVAHAIAEPEIVLQDRDYGDRRHHIRRDPNGLYIVAVVEYRYASGQAQGLVITAFLRSRLRVGDEVLFVRSGGDR